MTDLAPKPRLIILILLTALSTLSLNMFAPSLANMATDFETSYAKMNMAIAGYLGVVALMQILIGPLSDRFGRRPILLVCLLIFLIATIGCLMSESVETFLAFRMMQTTVYGGWVLSMAMVRDTSEQKEAATMISYITMAMALAPMLGPVMGGVLDEFFNWRATFWVYLISGALLLLFCFVDLKETNLNRSSSMTEQWRSYPQLLTAVRYWGYVLCQAFSVGAFYIFVAGAPLVATVVFEISVAKLGLIIGSITAGFMFGSFLSSQLTKRVRLTSLILSGRLVACTGLSIGLALVLAGHVSPFIMFAATMCVGVGNGLTVPSCAAGFMSVIPKLAGSAAGLAGAMAVAIGAVMTTVSGVTLSEQNGAYALIGFMLGSSLVSLAAILMVRKLEASR